MLLVFFLANTQQPVSAIKMTRKWHLKIRHIKTTPNRQQIKHQTMLLQLAYCSHWVGIPLHYLDRIRTRSIACRGCKGILTHHFILETLTSWTKNLPLFPYVNLNKSTEDIITNPTPTPTPKIFHPEGKKKNKVILENN